MTGALSVTSVCTGVLRWVGCAENKRAKIRITSKTGNHETPHITGPKGTIQNCAAYPAKNRMAKSTTNGTREFPLLYGAKINATITANTMAPMIPIFYNFPFTFKTYTIKKEKRPPRTLFLLHIEIFALLITLLDRYYFRFDFAL